MSSGLKILLVIVTLAVLAAGLALVRRSLGPPAPPGQEVDDDTAPAIEVPPVSDELPPHTFTGVVFARSSLDVAAAIGGRLESVPVQLGEQVTRGEVLATLDAERAQSDLRQARASLRAELAEVQEREIELAEADARLERMTGLEDVIAETERATATSEQQLAGARLEAARARVVEQEARIQGLEQTLAQAEIRAPFDGTVAILYQDPGALLQSGERVLRLISSDDLWVRFALPQAEATRLRVGSPIEVELEIDSIPTGIPGTIRHIAPEVAPSVELVIVEARLDVPDRWRDLLRSGAVGRVGVPELAGGRSGNVSSPAASSPPN